MNAGISRFWYRGSRTSLPLTASDVAASRDDPVEGYPSTPRPREDPETQSSPGWWSRVLRGPQNVIHCGGGFSVAIGERGQLSFGELVRNRDDRPP